MYMSMVTAGMYVASFHELNIARFLSWHQAHESNLVYGISHIVRRQECC